MFKFPFELLVLILELANHACVMNAVLAELLDTLELVNTAPTLPRLNVVLLLEIEMLTFENCTAERNVKAFKLCDTFKLVNEAPLDTSNVELEKLADALERLTNVIKFVLDDELLIFENVKIWFGWNGIQKTDFFNAGIRIPAGEMIGLIPLLPCGSDLFGNV